MNRLLTVALLLLMSIGCGAPTEKEAAPETKPEEVAAEAPVPDEGVTPMADPNILAQNVMVIAQRMQNLERSLNNMNAIVTRLDFYATELAKDPTLQGPYASAEQAWVAAVEDLRQKQQALRDELVLKQQAELGALKKRLDALEESNGAPESPAPPTPEVVAAPEGPK